MMNTVEKPLKGLEKTVRASIRTIIRSNEYAFRNSAESQRKYRDTPKGREAVKRQNDKVSGKNQKFSSLASKLQLIIQAQID